MCGFCGVIGPAGRASVDDVEPMARTLVHRGPDDFGTWREAFRVGEARYEVGLGHTRLAILDPTSLGRQPMSSEDGDVTVSYNGEIYNFRELRRELEAEGFAFRSDCDTEVLIAAYRAWGSEAWQRLVGMFAFALFDRARSRLFLVRDRLGIKPLFYRWSEGVLSFGSELCALRRHSRFEPHIDREALGGFLRFGYVTGERSIYEDTRRLMPGEFLVWEGGDITRQGYWAISDPPPEPLPENFEDVVDHLESLLRDAVGSRLIADVPLGAFLSGGIDSSTVVALMQEQSERPIRTFSIGFEDPEFDEAPYAAAVARHLGTEHTELTATRAQVVEMAREIPALYDEPFADSSAVPTALLSRMTREHVTVALSGDGGDELFAGYDRYAKLARLESLLRLPGPARRLLAAAAPWAPSRSIRNGLSHLRAEDACGATERMQTHFPYEDVRAACGAAAARPRPAFGSAFRSAPGGDLVRAATFADARTYLPDDILTKLDRASMAVGLEARVPILDHRVVQFCLQLPREMIWHGNTPKAPLRELLYRRVPRRLVDRPKRGFTLPLHQLMRPELADWKRRYLDPARVAEEGILDPAGVARLLQHAHGDDHLSATRLWFLLGFQRWFAHTHRGEALA